MGAASRWSRPSNLWSLLGAFGSRVGPGLLTFLGAPLLIRAYGVTEYGSFARLWAASLIVVALFTAWQRQAIIRDAGRHEGARIASERYVLPLQILLSAGSVVIITLLTTPTATWGLILVTILYSASLVLHAIETAYLQRDLMVRTMVIGEIARALVTSIAPLVVTSSLRSAETLVVFATAGVWTYLVVIVIKRRRSGLPRASIRPYRWTANAWGFGWPLSLWQSLSYVMSYGDRLLVVVFASPVVAAQYAAMSDFIVRGVGMLAMPLTFVAHTLVMRSSNTNSPQETQRVVVRWTIGLGLWLLVILGGLIALGTHLATLVLGNSVLPSGAIYLLSLMACFWQLGLMLHKTHEAAGHTRTMLGCISVAVLVSVIIQLLAGRSFGVYGVAAGTVFGSLIYLGAIWSTNSRAVRALSSPKWRVAASHD